MKIKLTATCGCGWRADNVNPPEASIPLKQNESKLMVAAMNHSEDTGHTVDLRGEIRSEKVRPR